jgi:ABC-2 type transport system ATP-binding protein
MADVEALCERVLVIHHGRLLFDGGLSSLAAEFSSTKTITVQLADGTAPETVDAALAEVARLGHTFAVEDRAGADAVTVRADRADAARVAVALLQRLEVADVSIEDPPLEDVIDRVFSGE